MDPNTEATIDPIARTAQTEPARVARVAKSLFLAVSQEWGLSAHEQAQLLGFMDSRSFDEVFLDKPTDFPEVLLVRISHLWNIHKAIVTLAPSASRGGWIRHHSAVFSGASPLEFMMREGEAGVIAVHRYLSSQTQS